MMKRPKFSRGFTLVEILVALFVFSILSLLIASALRSVIQSQAGTEKSAERLREMQFALLLLSRDIEQAVPRPVLNTNAKEEPAFFGDDKSFTFTHGGFANPDSMILRSSLQRTQYLAKSDSLWRGVWEVLDQAPTSRSRERLILSKVRKVKFEYLDRKGKFHSFWPAENKDELLPRAIRLHVELADWGSISQLYVISAEQSKLQAPASAPKL